METMVVGREQALWLVARLLAEYDPDVRMELIRSDGTIIICPQGARSELLQWAERISDKYEDVFRRLAET